MNKSYMNKCKIIIVWSFTVFQFALLRGPETSHFFFGFIPWGNISVLVMPTNGIIPGGAGGPIPPIIGGGGGPQPIIGGGTGPPIIGGGGGGPPIPGRGGGGGPTSPGIGGGGGPPPVAPGIGGGGGGAEPGIPTMNTEYY